MVKITGEYQGDLHCLATHEPSANTLVTDAPKDNQGRGEAFSPTDLTATSNKVSGDGWTLTLADGWELRPAEGGRGGDVVAVKRR